jgi:hypothetical protein
MNNIVKGTLIKAQWLKATPASLAGVQMKVGAVAKSISGVVRHIRGDHPTDPTIIKLYVEPESWDGEYTADVCDCHDNLVEIDPMWVYEVNNGDPTNASS